MIVEVFDRDGRAWRAEVGDRGPGLACLRLVEPLPGARPAGVPLLMAVSVLKRRAMDWMIEKLSELDVAAVQPLRARRTVAAPESGSKADPLARWERIALAAAKQSGRAIPMRFDPITPLPIWLARERPPVLSCFAHPGPGAVGLGEWLSQRAGMNLAVQVAVGPEGGWTPGEAEAFRQTGFTAVHLGPLVLRAETAAVTVAAACRVML